MPDMREFKKFQLHYIGGPSRPLPTAEDRKKANILNLYTGRLDAAKRRLMYSNRALIEKAFKSVAPELANKEEIVESVLVQLSVIRGNYENELENIERRLYEAAEYTEQALAAEQSL